MTNQEMLEIKNEVEHSEIPKQSQVLILKACEKQVAVQAIITGHYNAIGTDVGYCPLFAMMLY